MRICLLGDFTGNPDEGMKNVATHICHGLSQHHDVLKAGPSQVFSKSFSRTLRSFDPEIVHYLHGPTIRSLVAIRSVALYTKRRAQLVVSATRPYFSRFGSWVSPLFRPDLVLTQSEKYEEFFRSKGFRTRFFPNGVDCDGFTPPSSDEKAFLREKLGLPQDKRICLHVGHIKTNRNLGILCRIQQMAGVQAIVLGSTTEDMKDELKAELEAAGVIIRREFVRDVSQYYKSADVYVFPVQGTSDRLPRHYNEIGAIDLPLSVLEAMACNLPVVTTPFGALTRLFEEGQGFAYAKTEEELLACVGRALNGGRCNTRSKVLPYDWGNLVKRLEAIYKELLHAAPLNRS